MSIGVRENARYFKKMKRGDTCIIHISDKGSIKDIPKLLKKQGYLFTEKVINSNVLQVQIES